MKQEDRERLVRVEEKIEALTDKFSDMPVRLGRVERKQSYLSGALAVVGGGLAYIVSHAKELYAHIT